MSHFSRHAKRAPEVTLLSHPLSRGDCCMFRCLVGSTTSLCLGKDPSLLGKERQRPDSRERRKSCLVVLLINSYIKNKDMTSDD